MNKAMKVVVLLSGGLDSLLSLAELVAAPLSEVERVFALIFNYGQSSVAEIDNAKRVCEAWGVPYRIDYLPIAGTDTTKEIPARNLIFISHAAALAKELSFNTIAIGAEPDSTYTDSSPAFLADCDRMLRLFDVSLIAPVKNLQSKRALVERALELGVPLHLCHSSRSNAVDGNCITSSRFLATFGQIFPSSPMLPTEILTELGKQYYTYDLPSHTFCLRYGENNSFKYPAALFTVLGDPLFRPESPGLEHRLLNIYSTGSWMRDMRDVLALPSIRGYHVVSVSFVETHSLHELMNQRVNCSSHWAKWGMKQALSMLKRPRYSKYIACRVTQGHLAATLTDLGYVIEAPASRKGLLLETDPAAFPAKEIVMVKA